MQLLSLLKELSLHPKNAEELKGLILQLAVQGKLTAKWRNNNPKVEGASELLKLIEAEKELQHIDTNEIPYELSPSWSWSKFIDVAKLRHGHQFRKYDFVEEGIPVIKIGQCKSDGTLDFSKCNYIDPSRKEEFKDDLVFKGHLLMALTGGTLGKVTRVDKDYGVLVQNYRVGNFFADERVIKLDFLNVILESELFQGLVRERINQNAQPNIGKDNIEKIVLPIPPLEEQKAIVEVVNQLFTEVDALEELTKERISLKEDFVTSALRRLTETDNTTQEWNYLQQHFSSFFTEKKNIKSLRETILQLAVQGKLTAQWRKTNPSVENASELLKRIEAEKQQLIAEKKIKKEKPLPPIKDEDKSYELPEGWVWCKLGQVCLRLIDGNYGESYPKKHEFINDGIPFFTAAAVGQNYDIKDAKVKFISSEKHSVLTKAQTTVGDVLLTNRGGRVGDVAIITDDRYAISNIGPQVTRIAVSHANIYKRYIMYCIASPLFQRTIIELNSGSAMNFMNLTKTANMLIALPSKKEQYEIVEGINSLMALCDELEQQVDNSQSQIEQLMQSCLKEVFEQESN